MKKIPALIFAVLLLVFASCTTLLRGQPGGSKSPLAETPDDAVAKEAQMSPAQDSAPRMPLQLPLVKPKIVVGKSKRRLDLYAGERLVRTYKIALGFNPVADKTREGDGSTPEGSFYVFTKNAKSAFHLSLGISYPNEDDARRGLRDGLISRKQYLQILRAVERKSMPPQYTALGGLIYIHGGGTASDWTLGCVALENDDIRELFDAVPTGTTVVIEP